jgi:SMC interacting uncharacterized protein involved in chromosome segregation
MNDKQKKALEGYNHFISLRSHNLELGLVDEIKAGLQQYTALKGGIDKVKNNAKTAVIKYSDSVKVAAQNANKVIASIVELDKKAKDLGLADVGYAGYKKEMTAKANEYKALLATIDKIYASI